MLMAVSRTGTQSLQRRFFAVKRGFSEKPASLHCSAPAVDFVPYRPQTTSGLPEQL
jgi:hypothetical protein